MRARHDPAEGGAELSGQDTIQGTPAPAVGSVSLVPIEGEVLSEDEYLEALAARVRSEHRRSREAIGDAVDAYFVIGSCLLEAREALPSDQAFGAWFRACEFGFQQKWAHVLRTAAENEVEVRGAVSSQLLTGQPNFEKAVKQVTASSSKPAPKPAPKRSSLPAAAEKAGWQFRKSVERLERIADDDRFAANKEQVAAQWQGHLDFAADVVDHLRGLLDPPERPKAAPRRGPRRKHAGQLDALLVDLQGCNLAFEDLDDFDASVNADEAARIARDLTVQIRSLNRINKLLKGRAPLLDGLDEEVGR